MDEANDFSGFELFKQGAEARLRVGMFLGGKKAILKERFAKKYRHPDLDAKLTKERFRGEVRSLVRCKTIPGLRTPTLYFVDQDKSLFVMEFVQGMTCRDYIQTHRDDQSKLTGLATSIGRLIGTLHSNNLIHGDLTTSNLLVEQEGGLCLIDFGLGYVDGSQEDKGVDLYVLERALTSTHPGTEFMFKEILSAYQAEIKDKKVRAEIIRKYEEIRMRGRKRDMLG